MKLLIFAGTYEGRKLCEHLSLNNIKATVCVATSYGEDIISNMPNISVHCSRLNQAEMETFIVDNKFDYVIDATHPYAQEVTKNIQSACEKTNIEYTRLLRDEKSYDNIITVKDTKSAVDYLKNTQGNVLVTTGSKELSLYSEIQNYSERIYARVLPSVEVLENCNALSLKGQHIICMQGPFSYEMNVAMLKQFNCSYLVTKNTGSVGGLDEKILAAQATDTKVILIDRPQQEIGYSLDEVITLLDKYYPINAVITNELEHEDYFPLFISSKGKKVLVIGGGVIATRRVLTLAKFSFDITVIAPTITNEIETLMKNNRVKYNKREFSEKDIMGNDIVVVATNNREVNALAGKIAKELGLYASVADKKEECNFYFPAIITKDNAVIGVTSQGKSHKLVKQVATQIKEALH